MSVPEKSWIVRPCPCSFSNTFHSRLALFFSRSPLDSISVTTMKDYWSLENGLAKSDLSNLSDIALPHAQQSPIAKFESPQISDVDSADRTSLFENLVLDDLCLSEGYYDPLNDAEDIFYTREIIPEPEEDTKTITFPAPIETSHRVWADMVSTKESKMLQHAADLPLWNAFYTIEAMMKEYKSFRVVDDSALSLSGHGSGCDSPDAIRIRDHENCK